MAKKGNKWKIGIGITLSALVVIVLAEIMSDIGNALSSLASGDKNGVYIWTGVIIASVSLIIYSKTRGIE